MPELEFDPIARQIGRQRVVSFRCYVSQPLSRRDKYCLVINPWFDDWVLIDKDDVVASIAGTRRADGQSVVWVKRFAEVVRKSGTKTTKTRAYDVALDVAVDEAKLWSGQADPPPYKQPK